MNFSNMTLHLNHENVIFLGMELGRIGFKLLFLTWSQPFLSCFLVFFSGGLLASFEKEF